MRYILITVLLLFVCTGCGKTDKIDYTKRGIAWHDKGDYDKAIEDFDEAIRLDPTSAISYNYRGFALSAKGEYDKAIEDFDEAIRLDPTNAAACNNRGLAWSGKGEYDKAIRDYNKAVRIDPKLAAAFNNRGFALSSSKGEHDKAIKDYNEAVRLDPTFAAAFNNRGLAWGYKGEYDKAIKDYNEAIRLDPTYAEAIVNLAWLMATCPEAKYRDGAMAVKHAAKACELTTWKKAGFIGTLAAAYAETGDFTEAIKRLEQAMELAAEDEKAVFQFVLTLYKQGKPVRTNPKK